MRAWYLLPFLASAATAQSDLPTVLDDFRQVEVIILGEIHDNPTHHENQALAIRSIFPSAVVFEMFSPEQAARINSMRWDGGELTGLEDEFEWHRSGWPSFDYYRQLLEADPEGVVYGGAIIESQGQEAAFEGALAIYGPDGVDYGLDQPLTPEETSLREAEFILSHCTALDDGELAGLIEIDRLRAAVLADAVLLALEEASYPVVVIVGNDLAREDYGVPAMLRMIYPDILVKSLGQVEESVGANPPYSHLLVTGTIEREDPCLDFSE